MNEIKKGFTLLEALVIFGIIAVLMSLGIFGVLSFRATLELQNSSSDVVSFIRSLQNRSRNVQSINLNGNQIVPDFYTFTIGENNISVNICDNVSNFDLECESFTGISTPEIIDSVTLSSNCTEIGFATRNEDIVSLVESSADDSVEVCDITIIHEDLSEPFNIEININENSIKFE